MESNVTTIETANNNTTTITTDTRMDLILTRRGIENSANGRKNYKSIGTELIRDDDSKKYYYNTEGYDQLQEKHDELKRKFFELNKELEDKKKQPRLCDDDDGLDGKTIKILKALSKVKEKLNDKAYYDSIYVPAFEYFKKPDQKDYKNDNCWFIPNRWCFHEALRWEGERAQLNPSVKNTFGRIRSTS
ncbi:15320_t:CDS:2 [Entrophospora sp. SA101]|nr:14159_t:CDS:2 [Entrophospora sp. SA101]CAJ0767687.1 15320_t:CDS:2 [Entrophospora sp. SA101]CAJ0842117.1 3445_t:CDS:2 [Entrophospora sp. SA101]CAJ0893861.1 16883_t:CDS:2 [Entrophospora sp. SA101]